MQTLNKDEALLTKAFEIGRLLEKNALEIDIKQTFPLENLLELKKKKSYGFDCTY